MFWQPSKKMTMDELNDSFGGGFGLLLMILAPQWIQHFMPNTPSNWVEKLEISRRNVHN